MNYLSSAIDMNSKWSKKYIKLVSSSDRGDSLEVHHIVPVAFYEIVLGKSYTRHSDSIDMKKENLVSLSRGHHLLAHYYLYKCAMPCIKAAMAGALSMMLKGRDVKERLSELTEKQVLEMANAADEAKKFSGWKVRRLPTGFIGKYLYVEGKITHGFILKPNGSVRRYADHVNGFVLDEGWDPEVAMWGTNDCNVIAHTDGRGFSYNKVVYQSDKIPTFSIDAACRDIFHARLALTFKPLICTLYPRFKNRFEQEWEESLMKVKKKFPNAKPFEFIKPPKV